MDLGFKRIYVHKQGLKRLKRCVLTINNLKPKINILYNRKYSVL